MATPAALEMDPPCAFVKLAAPVGASIVIPAACPPVAVIDPVLTTLVPAPVAITVATPSAVLLINPLFTIRLESFTDTALPDEATIAPPDNTSISIPVAPGIAMRLPLKRPAIVMPPPLTSHVCGAPLVPVKVQMPGSLFCRMSKPRYCPAAPRLDTSNVPALVPPRISVLVVDTPCALASTIPAIDEVPARNKVLSSGPKSIAVPPCPVMVPLLETTLPTPVVPAVRSIAVPLIEIMSPAF